MKERKVWTAVREGEHVVVGGAERENVRGCERSVGVDQRSQVGNRAIARYVYRREGSSYICGEKSE